jgi:hypothetical protein
LIGGSAVRGEWLRVTRRPDVQVAIVAIPVLGALALVSGYLGEVGRLAQLPPDAPDNLRVQVEVGIERFVFPQTLVTVLGTYALQTLAFLYLGIALTATEFSSGTVRTWLIASGDRRSYLGARTSTLAVVVGFAVAELLAIGAVSLLIPSDRAVPTRSDFFMVDPLGTMACIGATLLAGLFCIAVGAFVAMLSRNGLVALLLIVLSEFLEVAVSGLPIMRDGPAGNVAQFLPTQALTALRSGSAAAAGVPSPDAPVGSSTALGLPAAFAVVAFWTAIAILGIWVRFLRVDIKE